MDTKPSYTYGVKVHFWAFLLDGGKLDDCPNCGVRGARLIERWDQRPFSTKPGLSFSRHTMVPCHCVVVSTKGLGGLGERPDIPYPPDDDDAEEFEPYPWDMKI